MGSHHHQVAALVPDEKLCVLIINAGNFSKQNKTSFIRDRCCHLADDGSPLSWNGLKFSRFRASSVFGSAWVGHGPKKMRFSGSGFIMPTTLKIFFVQLFVNYEEGL